jgi:hypothetical protein
MSKLKLSHWKERTPEFWRRVGNTALYGLPLLQIAIMSSPLSTDVRLWTGFVLTLALVGIKTLTKFLKEGEVNEE